MKRVALFARVSNESQAGEERYSIPAQLDFMRDRCQKEGWSVSAEYVAGGESAFTGNLAKRPTLMRAMRDAAQGEFEILMIHESSRLARNERLAHEILDTLHGHGVSLICADSPIDFATAEGRVYFGVQQDMNAYWSRKMSEHIKKGKARRFASGLPGGALPIGYEQGPGGVAVPVEPEARAIQRAFRQRAGGVSLASISGSLEKSGVHPRSRLGYERFTVSSVQSLLENRFYAGFVVHRGEFKRGQHEPIVTEEEWLAAQSVTTHLPRKGTTSPALLAGVARCFQCGGPIWTTTTGARGNKVVSYREPSHLQYRDCPATRTMWSAREPDATVSGVITAMGLDTSWLERVDRQARRPAPADASERIRVEAMRTRTNRAYIAGAMPEEEWQATLAELNLRLARLAREPVHLNFAGSRLQSMADLWAVATTDQRRRAVRVLFRAVHLDTRHKEIRLEPTPEFLRLFELRRSYVVGVPPAGAEGRHATHLFMPRELVRASA